RLPVRRRPFRPRLPLGRRRLLHRPLHGALLRLSPRWQIEGRGPAGGADRSDPAAGRLVPPVLLGGVRAQRRLAVTRAGRYGERRIMRRKAGLILWAAAAVWTAQAAAGQSFPEIGVVV